MNKGMPPESWYFSTERKYKRVSREKFLEYIDRYPRKLVLNRYAVFDPVLLTWNDFELADRWPYSIVARTFDYEGSKEPEKGRNYYILANITEVFASRTGKTFDEWRTKE